MLFRSEGILFEQLVLTGRTRWILPLGIWHRVHLRFGLQFCPDCLADGKQPYFRRIWRLACVTCCVEHRRPLLDRCHKCGYPVNFQYIKGFEQSLSTCATCGTNLSHAQAPRDAIPVVELRAQRELLRAIELGWIEVGDCGPQYSQLYFEGLWMLAQMLQLDRAKPLLRTLLGDEMPRLSRSTALRKSIEFFDASARRTLVLAAWMLTRGWPSVFLRLCRKYHIRAIDVMQAHGTLPYWLDEPIRRELITGKYIINDAEVDQGVRALCRLGLPLTRKNIYGLLGQTVPERASGQIRRVMAAIRRDEHPHKLKHALASSRRASH